MKRLTDVSFVAPIGRQHPERIEFCLIGSSICFESKTIMPCCLPIARVHGSGNHEVGVALLAVILNNIMSECLFPVIRILNFAGLDVSVPKEGII